MAPLGPGVTVIGLDAATLDVVRPLVAAGELPNLARLIDEGAHGPLRSTTHPLTPVAWTTMTTGVNAGRHGVWDFTRRDESGYHLRLVNGGSCRAEAIWDLLSRRGRRVGVVNVPFTWPAPKVNGFAIAGMDASRRDDGTVEPESLLRELRRRFPDLALDHRFPFVDGRLDLDVVRRACRDKLAATLWLSERFDPELLFVVFMSADHIHHLRWPDWEERGAESDVAEVYRLLDEATGGLVEAGGPQRNVAVVSDHGGGSLEGVVNLNAWLAREGYLAYADGGGLLPPREAARRAVHSLYFLQRRLPQSLRRRLKRLAPKAREQVLALREFSVVDWSRTRAFSYGTFGNVVVNLRGRERDGIVDPADFDRVRAEVAAGLEELRGPDGGRIVKRVHRREELYHGDELERLPDLIVEFDRYAWLGKGPLMSRSDGLWDEIEISNGAGATYCGSHRHEGLIVLAGPAAATGATIAAGIEDVAPTLTYLLGEELSPDFEGRVLTEAIDPSLVDRDPPRYADDATAAVLATAGGAYTDEDEDEVAERLRSLGYLE